MKKLYREEYETWTEDANKIAYEFSDLVKDFIIKKMEEYSSIELENVFQAELSMIFAYGRLDRNDKIHRQKYKDSLVEALGIEHYLLSKNKEKYLEILKNKTIMDRMSEASITLESSVEDIYKTKFGDVNKGMLLSRMAYKKLEE